MGDRKYTEKQLDILYEGIAMGQRITATYIDQQISKINKSISSATVKLIMIKIKQYLSNTMNITKDDIKNLKTDLFKTDK